MFGCGTWRDFRVVCWGSGFRVRVWGGVAVDDGFGVAFFRWGGRRVGCRI